MPRRASKLAADLDAPAIAAALTPWFEAHARPMSWRETRDPYAIWVSEIMLQQTRVDTVERHYPGFVARFPTVHALARADEIEVTAQWSGLGYYRRARLLHAGARVVCERFGGQVPERVEHLREIPGIGAYTAGAIASIAHDQPAALVDGNVARVLSRLRAIEAASAQTATAPGHWRDAAAIVGAGRPRVIAQALMELGATVCTPSRPSCDRCPLAKMCAARHLDRVDSIPAPRARKAVPVDDFVAWLCVARGRVLLPARAADELLAGMRVPPLRAIRPRSTRTRGDPTASPRTAGAALPTASGAQLRSWARSDLGVEIEGLSVLAPIEHVFTHRRWRVVPCLIRIRGARPCAWPRDAWVPLAALPHGAVGSGAPARWAIPSLTSRLLAAVRDA